jgi:succinate dehydrogenase / fumarate reductase cytochrome b subunit
VNDKRPVNLDIGSIELPVAALVSILHRASGALLVAGVAVLLCLLDESLASEESFNAIQLVASSFFSKLLLWAVLSVLIYHTVAGIRHLFMDAGIGESLEAGTTSAKAVLVIAVALIVMTGALIW